MFCSGSLYKALNGYMPDMDLLRVSETYANFSLLTSPLVTTMEMSADVPLVESAFGPVQAGSVLSYQLPQPKTREIVKIADVTYPPILLLDGYRLQASQCAYVLSHQAQFQVKALETTYEMSHKVKVATREQSSSPEWHQLRKMRITSSRFREVCHVRGETSADHLAEQMFKGSGMQTMEMKIQNGELKLKRSHAYYWQVQGQILLTGCSWCDFVICAQEDVLVERIYKDLQVSKTIREKVDHFYFYHYLQKCLSHLNGSPAWVPNLVVL